MSQELAFRNVTISDFMDMLSRDVPPLPAGGCAAALCGAVAASLGIMITRIIIHHSIESSDKEILQRTIDDLFVFQKTFLILMDEDQMAYENVIKAIRNLRDTDKAVVGTEKTLQDAYLTALKPPMEMIETSVKILGLFQYLVENIRETLKADMTVAIEAICACFNGSHTIAEENLKKIQEFDILKLLSKRLNDYKIQFESILLLIVDKV
jgi:methenyltetrahydrofolate cyclohydrolase